MLLAATKPRRVERGPRNRQSTYTSHPQVIPHLLAPGPRVIHFSPFLPPYIHTISWPSRHFLPLPPSKNTSLSIVFLRQQFPPPSLLQQPKPQHQLSNTTKQKSSNGGRRPLCPASRLRHAFQEVSHRLPRLPPTQTPNPKPKTQKPKNPKPTNTSPDTASAKPTPPPCTANPQPWSAHTKSSPGPPRPPRPPRRPRSPSPARRPTTTTTTTSSDVRRVRRKRWMGRRGRGRWEARDIVLAGIIRPRRWMGGCGCGSMRGMGIGTRVCLLGTVEKAAGWGEKGWG
jgi:hypothetical protein